MQKCPLVRWERIRRHDFVVRRVEQMAQKRGWAVFLEPHIRCSDGTLKKPDLILARGSDIIVSDVAICWEGPSGLNSAHALKSSIYSTPGFISTIQGMYPDKNIFLLPLIIGARGIWCSRNYLLTRRLHLNGRDIANLLHTTMRGSIVIWRNFNRFVWRIRGN